MSWQIIKDLKEKRAVAFTAAGTIRALANSENRELKPEEKTKHDALFTEVESFNTRIATEERSLALGELITTNQAQQVRNAVTGDNQIGMPQKDFKRYSLLRAVRAKADGQQLDGVEAEVNIELATRMGKKAKGFYLPQDMRALGINKRTLNAATTGIGSIETTTESTFIDILRARLVLAKVGATFLTGLQGKIAIPQKTTTTSTYWVGEGGAPTAGQPVLAQVLFTPKTLGSFTDITRQFAEQTSLDAEAFVVDDLTKSMGIGIETASLVGSGTANQPQGIVGATNVSIQALGTNGADPTFISLIQMETLVANQNADMNNLNYLMTPACRGFLKGTPKSTSAVGAGFVWDDNEINGYPAFATNLLPNNGTKGSGTNLSTGVFGDFSSLVIGMWGALDIMVDPYTGSSSGTVRIVALQDLDIELRHAQSFAYFTDATCVPGA